MDIRDPKNYRLISVLMENQPGALSRLTGIFSARGFNIESLSVAPTDDPTLSRTTLSAYLSDKLTDQLIKQLNRLIDVVKVFNITETNHYKTELLLIKLDTSNSNNRRLIIDMVKIFKAQIVDVTDQTFVVQLCLSKKQTENFIKSVGEDLILEIVRSGYLGLVKGH